MRTVASLVTLLSLLLSLIAAEMWVRSQSVTEAWEFTPRPTPGPGRVSQMGAGWLRHRRVESADGRLLLARYDNELWLPVYAPAPTGGYSRPRSPFLVPKYDSVSNRLRLGNVAEWTYCRPVSLRGEQWCVSVSWLALILAFAVLPGAWAAALACRRWRQRRQHAFPVKAPSLKLNPVFQPNTASPAPGSGIKFALARRPDTQRVKAKTG